MSRNAKETSTSHFFGVGMQNTLNGFNIGGAIRALGCFGGSYLAVSGNRYKSRVSDFRCMDTELYRKNVPIFLGSNTLTPFIPYDSEIVVLELGDGSDNIIDFVHPRRAMYVFGPEDGAVDLNEFEGQKVHKVFIPSHMCLNLAASVYVTLYDRISKSKIYNVENTLCPNCGKDHWKINNENNLDGTIAYHCNACGHDWNMPNV